MIEAIFLNLRGLGFPGFRASAVGLRVQDEGFEV